MRDLQQRISNTVNRNPSDSCDKLSGEQFFYRFIIDEHGNISKMISPVQKPNECAELLEVTIRATEFTLGKVEDEPISTLFCTAR